ncbi:MAG: LytTR family DNA-binding domain-containing protein [Erysipelotrichaceae bacterium]
MRIAICDDNKDELVLISSIIETYIQERGNPIFYKSFHSSIELLAKADQENFDFYLLDMIMPTLNGMETAREIRKFDNAAKIAFLTSSPEFAIDSYSVKACNYILKPVSKEKLFFALDDIIETTSRENDKAIVVKSSEGIEKLLLSQIAYVEALDRRVIYTLASGKTVECTQSFSEVCEELLNHKGFTQPHRSYVVNMGYISSIKNTEIILQIGCSLPIAQRRVANMKERYLSYQMEKESL